MGLSLTEKMVLGIIIIFHNEESLFHCEKESERMFNLNEEIGTCFENLGFMANMIDPSKIYLKPHKVLFVYNIHSMGRFRILQRAR